MKKSLFWILALLWAAIPASALDAHISYATFYSPSGSYIEVYIYVDGTTATFNTLPDSTLQASLEVVILFKKQGEIVKYDKYRLNSPPANVPLNFIDLKRYGLENGHYDLEISVQDANQADNSKTYSTAFDVDYSADKLGHSDVQLLASVQPVEAGRENSPMIKNGFSFECLPGNFYHKSTSVLIFYNEIYNADKAIGDDYAITYSIRRAQDDKTVSIAHKRRSSEPITPLLLQMDISKLESGNYNLVVEVRNRDKELLSKKSVFFQRSNPFLNVSREEIAATADLKNEFVGSLSEEELRYSLKAIAMLVDDHDGELMNTLIKEKNLDAQRLYLFSYWAKENPVNPRAAFEAYMNVARKIDEKFRSGFGFGFETDRGYVFMKYGAPNDAISVEDDPSAPPYEIWTYHQFPRTGQNNVKFLFYNPSLATNGYVLLHSTARGEISNPRWEVELYRDAPNDLDGNNFIDGSRMKDNVGRYARRLFNDY
jgi:GWxTD domain-containing protein